MWFKKIFTAYYIFVIVGLKDKHVLLSRFINEMAKEFPASLMRERDD